MLRTGGGEEKKLDLNQGEELVLEETTFLFP